MANPEHVKVALQGAEALAAWRGQNPGVILDLHAAELSQQNLGGANLVRANLAEAQLFKTFLTGADLREADLRGADMAGADLMDARLSKARLSGCRLLGATMIGADLSAADLAHADIRGALLLNASLAAANLSRSQAGAAVLLRTNLAECNLADADLSSALFSRASLSGTDFSRASFHYTSLAELDLSQAVGLESAVHTSPSSVGVDTLIASFRSARHSFPPQLSAFLLSAGVPRELLDALPRVLADVKYYSCFISYGEPDLEFATELNEALKANGVSCWLYRLDATVGKRAWGEIMEKRREADKTVVLCSAKALVRQGVLKEIEEQIDEDPDKLLPISLDDDWQHRGFRVMRGERDLKPFLLDRNYADFANLPRDEALEKLLRGLERDREAGNDSGHAT